MPFGPTGSSPVDVVKSETTIIQISFILWNVLAKNWLQKNAWIKFDIYNSLVSYIKVTPLSIMAIVSDKLIRKFCRSIARMFRPTNKKPYLGRYTLVLEDIPINRFISIKLDSFRFVYLCITEPNGSVLRENNLDALGKIEYQTDFLYMWDLFKDTEKETSEEVLIDAVSLCWDLKANLEDPPFATIQLYFLKEKSVQSNVWPYPRKVLGKPNDIGFGTFEVDIPLPVCYTINVMENLVRLIFLLSFLCCCHICSFT